MSNYGVGIVFGGVLISSLGAASTYYFEEKVPSTKSLFRDFIIGSILFLFIMYLLPDSSSLLVNQLIHLIPTSVSKMEGGYDMEIDVGVPKF